MTHQVTSVVLGGTLLSVKRRRLGNVSCIRFSRTQITILRVPPFQFFLEKIKIEREICTLIIEPVIFRQALE